jgi:hypothetical protein
MPSVPRFIEWGVTNQDAHVKAALIRWRKVTMGPVRKVGACPECNAIMGEDGCPFDRADRMMAK